MPSSNFAARLELMTASMEAERKMTVVQRGTYLNDQQVVCEVRVVRLELRPDEPTSSMYCIQWESPAVRGKFSSGLFGFRTVEEAAAHVEKSAAAVRWMQ